MQKFINIRTSQFSLKENLEKFTAKGWKVVDVTKGSELSRFMLSMRWTVTLENNAEDADEQAIYDIAKQITSESWRTQLIAFLGALVACGVVFALCFGIPYLIAR